MRAPHRDDRGGRPRDARRDRPARRGAARGRPSRRRRRAAAWPRRCRDPCRAPPLSRARRRRSHSRVTSVATTRSRPGGVSNSPGGAHQRRAVRRGQRRGRDQDRPDALEAPRCGTRRADGEPDPDAGHGLIGMRERAVLLGGSLDGGRRRRFASERACTARRACCARADRVLLVDDDDLMRAGLTELLSSDESSTWSARPATAGGGVERTRADARRRAMDVRMPDLDGISATREASPLARIKVHPHDVRAGRLHLRRAQRGASGSCSSGRARGPDRRDPHDRRR